MTPRFDAPHPLADPAMTDRLAVLRTMCVGLAAALVVLPALIAGVVQFALDGQPLAGNGVQVAGLAAVTWLALLLAVAAPFVGLTLSTVQKRNGLEKLAAEPAPADPGRLLDVFAAATFAEFAVADGAGAFCAVLYHVTADPVLIAAAVALAAYLGFRMPTTDRARRWYDEATARLGDLREGSAR